MQILRYTPQTGDGIFDLPLPALLKYLEDHIPPQGRRKTPQRQTLRALVAIADTPYEILTIKRDHVALNDLAIADVVDRGSYTVYCPHCQTHYTPSQLHRQPWAYFRGPADAGGGRAYECTLGHTLLRVQDWIS